MQFIVYAVTVVLVAAGVFLIRGRQNTIRLHRMNMVLSGRRFVSKAGALSKKMKFREWLVKRKGEKIDKEIYESISFLRNILALGDGRRVGADHVIEQLSQREGALQPVYIRMLRFLRLGKLEDAIKAFSSEAFTPTGFEFGNLLLKWDAVDPAELVEILISYQKGIKEARSTVQRKRDELVSELIYFPVVINVFVIFINFIVVGYFMEQKHLLSMIF
ncbi:MAG: hypothetical protein FWG42_09895 [Clostridiales bacterium]|nr:hypothetical protein [Clostridiales bacterium]